MEEYITLCAMEDFALEVVHCLWIMSKKIPHKLLDKPLEPFFCLKLQTELEFVDEDILKFFVSCNFWN
jgi:hypothetical protein